MAGPEAKGPQEDRGVGGAGSPGASLGTPAGAQAHGAYLPGHKGVGFLQRGGIQLEKGSNVVAMGHSNQAVFDLLPSVPATCAALGTLW